MTIYCAANVEALQSSIVDYLTKLSDREYAKMQAALQQKDRTRLGIRSVMALEIASEIATAKFSQPRLEVNTQINTHKNS